MCWLMYSKRMKINVLLIVKLLATESDLFLRDKEGSKEGTSKLVELLCCDY